MIETEVLTEVDLATTASLNVGLIVLGEAGNLGDDLILLAVADALSAVPQVRRLTFLGHDSPLDWTAIRSYLPRLPEVRAMRARYEFPLERWSSRSFADCDFVLFGGGGLIQDSHHPLGPYYWLKFLPSGRPAYAVGLGLGPISESWTRFLSRGEFFEETFLRDSESVSMATSRLHWSPSFAHDYVDFPFLSQFARDAEKRNSLGVALRAWPGLDEDALVAKINGLVAAQQFDCVEFFVLESKGGIGEDVDLTTRIARGVEGATTEVRTYQGGDPVAFVQRMLGCSEALSMKLHSSAIWASTRIPQHPIVYAPKVASFFGVPWQGLEILDEVFLPDLPTNPSPRSRDVVIRISRGFSHGSPRRRIRGVSRATLQTATLVVDVWRKATAVARRSNG